MGCAVKKIPHTPVKKENSTMEVGPTQTSSSFVDKSFEMGPLDLKATQFYAQDLNGDHYLDLVALEDVSLPQVYSYLPQEKKYKNSGHLNLDSSCTSLAFFDFTRDGTSDLVCFLLRTGNWSRGNISVYSLDNFHKNKKITKINGLHLSEKDLNQLSTYLVSDFNGDGRLDLLLFFHSRERSPLFFWGSEKGFSQNTLKFKLDSDLYTHASLCDVDQDGKTDILASTSQGRPNYLWLNKSTNDEMVFQNFAKESSLASDNVGDPEAGEGGHTLSQQCCDYNNDHIMDVVQGGNWSPLMSSISDRASILTGSTYKFPFKFIRTHFESDEKSEQAYSYQEFYWPDLNGDGLWDLVGEDSGLPPHSRLKVMIQNKDHSFKDQGPLLGLDIVNPSGLFIFDANHDGLLDIVVGQTGVRTGLSPRSYLFIQQIKETQYKLIELALKGIKSNLEGIGSLVIIESNMRQRRLMIKQALNYFSVSKGEKIKNIKIIWPFNFKKKLIKNYRPVFTKSGKLTLSENGQWYLK